MGSKAVDRPGARLGAALRQARREKGLTLDALSRETGLSKSYLSYLEGGKYAGIGIDRFCLLVTALGARAEDLLGQAGYLPAGQVRRASLRAALREHLGLPERELDQAMSYLRYLSKESRGEQTTARRRT